MSTRFYLRDTTTEPGTSLDPPRYDLSETQGTSATVSHSAGNTNEDTMVMSFRKQMSEAITGTEFPVSVEVTELTADTVFRFELVRRDSNLNVLATSILSPENSSTGVQTETLEFNGQSWNADDILELRLYHRRTGGHGGNDFTVGVNRSTSYVDAEFAPPEPEVPTGLDLDVISATQIDASWNSSANSDSYELRRSLAGQNDWTTVYSGAGTSFSDTGVTADNEYDYQVRGVNVSGESDWSTTVTADTFLPDIPSGLIVSATTYESISISWDPADNAEDYDVERRIDGGSWTALSSALDATVFTDEPSSISPGDLYEYRVRANNNIGTSDWSAILEHTAGQVGVPASTISSTDWVNESGTTTNLHSSTSDDSPSTYIEATADGAIAVFAMANLSDPEVDTGHVISFRLEVAS